MSLFSLHCELACGSVNVRVYSWYWATDTTAWRGGREGRKREEGGREGRERREGGKEERGGRERKWQERREHGEEEENLHLPP